MNWYKIAKNLEKFDIPSEKIMSDWWLSNEYTADSNEVVNLKELEANIQREINILEDYILGETEITPDKYGTMNLGNEYELINQQGGWWIQQTENSRAVSAKQRQEIWGDYKPSKFDIGSGMNNEKEMELIEANIKSIPKKIQNRKKILTQIKNEIDKKEKSPLYRDYLYKDFCFTIQSLRTHYEYFLALEFTNYDPTNYIRSRRELYRSDQFMKESERKYKGLGQNAIDLLKQEMNKISQIRNEQNKNEEEAEDNSNSIQGIRDFLSKYIDLLPEEFSVENTLKSIEEIGLKKVMRKLALIFHPDTHQAGEDAPLYEEAFKELMNILPAKLANSIKNICKYS